MMGDGSLSRYQAAISLHRTNDAAYADFVTKFCEKLFGFMPGHTDRPRISVLVITLSRIEIVRYLNKRGLPIGHKIRQKLDMPLWVRNRRPYAIACVRGLVDTDGCIFTHRYKAKGRWYAYKKLSFSSASPKLRHTVHDLLTEWGMHPRFAGEKDIRLESTADIERYFRLVGTHNPKHLNRYRS